MNKSKLLLTLVFGIFVIFSSCKKKSFIDSENVGQSPTMIEKNLVENDDNLKEDISYDFYYNGILVNENPLILKENKNNDIKNIMIVFEKINKGEKKRISINSFSTDEQYIEWGKEHNIPVANILHKESLLKEFVEKNNTEEIFNKTGKLPDNFVSFTDNLLGGEKSGTAAFIFKDYHGGDSWAFINTIPTLKNTAWDNEISRYYDTEVYGAVAFYSGYWYKHRMATLWNWGWHNVRFRGALKKLNDKTSSLINY